MDKTIFFSVKTLLVQDNLFLGVYNFEKGKKIWDLPGGRMEFGETAEDTLKREIKEELDIEIIPIKVIDTWNYMLNDQCQITGIVYFSEMVSNNILLSEEHDGYEWIPFTKIDQIFSKEYLLEKMQFWNWDSIINSQIKFKK